MAAILGSLWPLSGNSKDREVINGYRGIESGTLSCHARTLTTALPSDEYQKQGRYNSSLFSESNIDIYLQ